MDYRNYKYFRYGILNIVGLIDFVDSHNQKKIRSLDSAYEKITKLTSNIKSKHPDISKFIKEHNDPENQTLWRNIIIYIKYLDESTAEYILSCCSSRIIADFFNFARTQSIDDTIKYMAKNDILNNDMAFNGFWHFHSNSTRKLKFIDLIMSINKYYNVNVKTFIEYSMSRYRSSPNNKQSLSPNNKQSLSLEDYLDFVKHHSITNNKDFEYRFNEYTTLYMESKFLRVVDTYENYINNINSVLTKRLIPDLTDIIIKYIPPCDSHVFNRITGYLTAKTTSHITKPKCSFDESTAVDIVYYHTNKLENTFEYPTLAAEDRFEYSDFYVRLIDMYIDKKIIDKIKKTKKAIEKGIESGKYRGGSLQKIIDKYNMPDIVIKFGRFAVCEVNLNDVMIDELGAGIYKFEEPPIIARNKMRVYIIPNIINPNKYMCKYKDCAYINVKKRVSHVCHCSSVIERNCDCEWGLESRY